MSNSSQPATSLDDLLKDLTIDLSDATTTTLTSSSINDYSYSYDSNTMSTITLSPSITSVSAVGGTYSIDSVSITSSFSLPKEWIDCFPDWHRVEDMCKKYPGLEIALRNFQTVYELVKDDYDNPTPKK